MNSLPRRQITIKRIVIGTILLGAATLLGAVAGCMTFTGDFAAEQSKMNRLFAERGLPEPVSHQIMADGHSIHYVDTGGDDRPLVIFIHGSPGSWDAFSGFLADPGLRREARLVSIDRPGYGGSEPGKPVPSLAVQAAVIKPILESNHSGRGAILVGHSLGGPIAARVAMDYPQLVAGLVLVAPSIDPAQEHIRWFQYAARWPIVRSLVPSDLRVCNLEIFPLKQELQAMMARWPALHQEVIVIQGQKDDLVPPENADFAARMMTGAKLTIVRKPDLNHFIPWTAPQLITDAIVKELRVPPAASVRTASTRRQPDSARSAAP